MNLLLSVLLNAFISFPSLSALNRAKETEIRLGQIANALEIFRFDCGYYPRNIEGLLINIDNCTHWGPSPYLTNPNLNLNDGWGRPIDYSVNYENFKLVSYGADGQEGGVDLDSDLVWNSTP